MRPNDRHGLQLEEDEFKMIGIVFSEYEANPMSEWGGICSSYGKAGQGTAGLCTKGI